MNEMCDECYGDIIMNDRSNAEGSKIGYCLYCKEPIYEFKEDGSRTKYAVIGNNKYHLDEDYNCYEKAKGIFEPIGEFD